MHIFMEHVHLLWHLMAFYIRNLAAKGLNTTHEHQYCIYILLFLLLAECKPC